MAVQFDQNSHLLSCDYKTVKFQSPLYDKQDLCQLLKCTLVTSDTSRRSGTEDVLSASECPCSQTLLNIKPSAFRRYHLNNLLSKHGELARISRVVNKLL